MKKEENFKAFSLLCIGDHSQKKSYMFFLVIICNDASLQNIRAIVVVSKKSLYVRQLYLKNTQTPILW